MARKYFIYQETGWDERNNIPTYKKLTTLKNEQSAIAFIHDIANVGKYGNMVIKSKIGDQVWEYNDKEGIWQWE